MSPSPQAGPTLRDFAVRCPDCREGRIARPAVDAEPACERCGRGFECRDGFLELLPGTRERRNFAQVLMEWPPLIRIYESRWWRRSPVVARAMGIDFEGELALVREAARLESGQRVLDLACGPGIYARPLAAEVSPGTVVGLDLSIPMLRFAAGKAREEGIANLLLVHGDAMALPFEDGRLDLVNCCGALHLFPDSDEVLGEIARVLAPGGRATLAVFRRGVGAAAERVARLRRRIGGVDAFTREQLSAALERAGFADPRCHHAAGNWLVMSASKP
jgi:SAM-dependent methyltransferase